MMAPLVGKGVREAGTVVASTMAGARLPGRLDVWWLAHLAGGAALAFCYLRAIAIARAKLGALRPAGAYLLAFALSCTTALAWEMGEFTIDQLAGTGLQQGNFDTMSDLILGTAGAAAYLGWHALIE